ncbi:unnamed protein product (macronuclear) [Paramecium tetraurelia]|uniref:Uncharacterized protein n=1 Tax=Paramecium tetraurelia TaxID=5888 RepID=A0BJ76_PARTE|nr:uncharacterized protein GSPATT00004966001 [Paramecium tetraurelia]CAK58593.1 unnamed protein product [Paramecium tetraurelia]|eukprot:XP_001425991.1 hypothetical protein (macronuclear) [Paramecium tetraurelia strain d4-2]
MGCINSKLPSKSQPTQSVRSQIQIQIQSQDESPYVIKKNPIFQRRASQKSIISPLQTTSYVKRNK